MIHILNELHDYAMEQMDLAFSAKRHNAMHLFRKHALCAYNVERYVADHAQDPLSKSVMYKSAGWIALDLDLIGEVLTCVRCGLATMITDDIIRYELLEMEALALSQNFMLSFIPRKNIEALLLNALYYHEGNRFKIQMQGSVVTIFILGSADPMQVQMSVNEFSSTSVICGTSIPNSLSLTSDGEIVYYGIDEFVILPIPPLAIDKITPAHISQLSDIDRSDLTAKINRYIQSAIKLQGFLTQGIDDQRVAFYLRTVLSNYQQILSLIRGSNNG